MFQDIQLSITGTKEIYIENYKGLLDYQDKLVAIQGKRNAVIFHGNGFSIDYFAGDSMKISGSITSIEFFEISKK